MAKNGEEPVVKKRRANFPPSPSTSAGGCPVDPGVEIPKSANLAGSNSLVKWIPLVEGRGQNRKIPIHICFDSNDPKVCLLAMKGHHRLDDARQAKHALKHPWKVRNPLADSTRTEMRWLHCRRRLVP
jgi:hypothetical protein